MRGREAVMPIDRLTGGTWIAANDAGLTLALLNASGGVRSGPRSSRGRIVPSLLHHATAGEAGREASASIDPGRYLPFRLLITDGLWLVEVASDGARLLRRTSRLGRHPLLFTSSGLGDQMVEGPRRRLFEAFFLRTTDRAKLQDAFHRHSWADRPHLSVRMERPGARTVSHTLIEVRGGVVRMSHTPGPPGGSAEAVVVTLPVGGVPRACAS